MSSSREDPRRVARVRRWYRPFLGGKIEPGVDDNISEYANLLAMLTSMMALMFKMKWCAWSAVYATSVSFANAKENDETKQLFSSFVLSVSALVMCYVYDPRPITLPSLFL